MADDRTRDELAQLRAQLAAQQADDTAQLAALRAVVGRPRHRMPRHHLRGMDGSSRSPW